MESSPTQQRGISVIEVLVGVSILSLTVIFLGYSITMFVAARDELLANAQRLYLAEEGYELIRALRDDNWSTVNALSTGTDYALAVSTTTISLGTVPEVIDGRFHRRFEVRSLYRNSDDDIVASTTAGATSDPNAREVIVTVSDGTATTSLRGILTNLIDP